ncbi:deoxyribonuclease IV [bacterium]|nr:MAG: deoxyribonuclease IV [bacterium]
MCSAPGAFAPAERRANVVSRTKSVSATMRFGLHTPIGKGYEKAIAYAAELGCRTIQFFSGNPRGFRITDPKPEAWARFAALRREHDLLPSAIHTSYLVNFATEREDHLAASLALVGHDLALASSGNVAYVNTHLGSYGQRGRAEGHLQVCRALSELLDAIRPGVFLVMENSAGAGNLVGGTLEELGGFLREVDHPQLAVCLDTAHAWAAGYKIDDAQGVEAFLDQVERHVGIARVKMFHVNDTVVPLGGQRDRHHHIGEGLIGTAGFAALLNHAALREKIAVLETPGERAEDERNLAVLRSLLA